MAVKSAGQALEGVGGIVMNHLDFFIHDDADAVRIELAGNLCGPTVESVHRTWRRVGSGHALKPVIVDITFVPHADEYGRKLLAIMHRSGARIIAGSPDSFAIAQPIMIEPIEVGRSRPGWFKRLMMLLPGAEALVPQFRHKPKFSTLLRHAART